MNSVPAIDIEGAARVAPLSDSASARATAGGLAWLGGLLQAGDSFYPTGSYAHSFGLEGLVQQGVVHDRETVRAFLFRSVLPSLREAELPLAAHAWDALGESDWPRIGELCHLSAALRTVRELRVAAENIGRQRAELTHALHQAPLAREYLERARTERWPFSPSVSAALEGRVLGAPREAVLVGIAYSNLASVLSAAMKLVRLGQNACQSLLAEALREIPLLLAAATRVSMDDIGWFNPWLDIAAARHETADARMFIS